MRRGNSSDWFKETQRSLDLSSYFHVSKGKYEFIFIAQRLSHLSIYKYNSRYVLICAILKLPCSLLRRLTAHDSTSKGIL